MEKRKINPNFMLTILLLVIFATTFIMAGCNIKPMVFDNPMIFAELKPESYVVITNNDGEVVGYQMKDVADMPARTVDFEIPTDEDELKALAYKLYAIGNKTMVTVPYASYYEKGVNHSKLNGAELPLIFNTVDMRNNITGEHFRQTVQTVDDTAEIDPFIQALMGGASESGQRWYVQAGVLTNAYYKTTKFADVEGGRECDWKNSTVEKSVSGYEEKRKNISINPIPYTSSGYKGMIDGKTETEVNVNGMKWVYDSESGYSIPQYVDGGGRVIGYEKTDQHVFFSTGDDANRYDNNGNLIEEDYYNTIINATVEYNAEGGYYTVHILVDSDKAYTHIDTEWALKDSNGAKDKNARFTGLEIQFQLWDNGYFKQWEMWENWKAPKAYGLMEMTADQYYIAVFSYNEQSADFSKYYSPIQPR